jgi:hypothetical protein
VANTKQQGAINAAQTLINLMQQAQQLRASAKAFLDTYNSEAWNTLWAQLQTYTANPDGSVGATDGAPNAAHPTSSVNKSSNQLVQGVVVLQQFLNFCQNVPVITAQYSQSIDDLSGF